MPFAASKSERCYFFLNHTHLHITVSIHKKRSNIHALIQHKATDADRSVYVLCFLGARSVFSIVLCCFNRADPPSSSPVWALVDSQWEISASGGAAVTWSPPFIKYLPAHSQHCTLFRIAPTIPFSLNIIQYCTMKLRCETLICLVNRQLSPVFPRIFFCIAFITYRKLNTLLQPFTGNMLYFPLQLIHLYFVRLTDWMHGLLSLKCTCLFLCNTFHAVLFPHIKPG